MIRSYKLHISTCSSIALSTQRSFEDYVINVRMANEGRVLCFAAGSLFTMAKGEKYSEDSHDTEVILAHYRVDKPSNAFTSCGYFR